MKATGFESLPREFRRSDGFSVVPALILPILFVHCVGFAQPVRPGPEGDVVLVPDAVEVRPDGTIHVVTREIAVVGNVMPPLPGRVQVFEVLPDGTRLKGLRFTNNEHHPIYAFERDVPSDVRLGIDQHYTVQTTITTSSFDGVSIPPGFVLEIAGSDSVPVYYDPPVQAPERGPAFQLIWLRNPGSYPPGVQAQFDALLDRVKARAEVILAFDVGLVRVNVGFANTPPGVSAAVQIRATTAPLSNVRQELINIADTVTEELLYEALPVQSANVIYPSGAPASVAQVRLNSALFGKLLIPLLDHDGAIVASTATANANQFDYDPRNWHRRGEVQP